MTVVVVIALIAAAFGGGWLWGEMRLRRAPASWSAEREKMAATVTETNLSLAALRSDRALWEIDGRLSEILADLADNNFGLAHDAAVATRAVLTAITPSLATSKGPALAALDGLLVGVKESADALSLNAKGKARQAQAILRAALGTATSGETAPAAAEHGAPGTG